MSQAFIAIRSSNLEGCSSMSHFCMPSDSNWNTPIVSPRENSA